jgi:flagellar motility protein MotE (MotC chaperone)
MSALFVARPRLRPGPKPCGQAKSAAERQAAHRKRKEEERERELRELREELARQWALIDQLLAELARLRDPDSGRLRPPDCRHSELSELLA